MRARQTSSNAILHVETTFMLRCRSLSGAFSLLRCLRDARAFERPFERPSLLRCNCSANSNRAAPSASVITGPDSTLASEQALDHDTIAAVVTGAPAALRCRAHRAMKEASARWTFVDRPIMKILLTTHPQEGMMELSPS